MMVSSPAMATLLPNPKPLFPHSLPDSRNFPPYSFPRLILVIDGEKPLRASSIWSCPRRECGVTFASRRRSRTASTSGGFDLNDVKEDRDDEEGEKEEEGDEDFVPLREMTRWMQNRPAGFGEGKTYDTAVEDKILEELERCRKNQLEENRNPRVTAKENARTVMNQVKQNVIDAIKCDTEVRVGNLPKKKNIDRDLWKAFKELPGITTISPVVTGNKKTRDPICRGFAIVGFESDDAAHRFIQKYSNQNLLFGKVQKQITCDIVNGNSAVKSLNSCKEATFFDAAEHRDKMSMPCTLEFSENTNVIPLAGENKEDFTVLPSNDTTVSLPAQESPEIAMAFENPSLSFSDDIVNKKSLRTESPMPCDQIRKKNVVKRESKPAKSSKPRILRSLARLKIKERAVLTGVFSKYGEAASSASKEL